MSVQKTYGLRVSVLIRVNQWIRFPIPFIPS